MIVSGGVVVKGTSVIWTGTPATWGTWPSSLNIGNRWASYSTLYRVQHWVRTCVDKRAVLLARLPLKVYQHDEMSRPEVPAHAYAQLLARPNDRQSRFSFWREMLSTRDIYGEAFALKIRDSGGRPVQLAPMHPTAMHECDEDAGRLRWDFENDRVRITGIPDEDLIHFKNYNPDSCTRGLSKLESLRSTLENEDAALRSQSSFWRRGARPGVALTHPGKLSQPAAERLKLRWDQIAAGADNTGTTVVLEEGMKPELMQITAAEAQYIEARKLNREEVVAGFDMPPPAVHILDHATYSNITEQMRSVYRDTMAPVTVELESELETQLRGSVRSGASAPDFGDNVYAEFLLDGVLRGDFEQRADAYQKAINSGWTTPAEVRKLENLPFIEGSDRLYINSTMVPLDEVQAATPPPSLDPSTLSVVMGRLGRQKTLADLDADWLVDGLNGHADMVTRALAAARDAGDDLDGFKERIKAL
ncbi:MAG TPA: phage portal protein [Acidimicrobiia bacterium]|nr:phage portal protein [Acidimicrobiia bacterium]